MNILFLHRAFPGQFKYLAMVLANNPQNNVVFVTNDERSEINGIHKILYSLPQINDETLSFYEKAVLNGKVVAHLLSKMKDEGFIPDIIYGFAGWGSTMFVKDVFPDVPLICYLEWFGKSKDSVLDFGGNVPSLEQKINVRSENSHMLTSLCDCDLCITPTQWQKQQFPKEFHDKIQVIHEGIDISTCKPDNNSKFIIPDKNLELGIQDEVLTYGTRGMEAYRGFPQFMEAAEKILKKRPNTHIVIAGDDISCYSPKLENDTYKSHFMNKLDLDMNRLHFVGMLSFYDYVKLLQISSAHVYSTVPYVLSWSVLNAMATECCIIASNTPPVLEVIKDNYNGLLFDFFNVEQLVEKIEYALDNQDKMQIIRSNARQTIIDNYSLEKIIPQQFNLINGLLNK